MTRDEVMPAGRWEFGEDVTEAFDDMLGRSVPQYEVMRAAAVDLVRRHHVDGEDVVDLGASRGDMIARMMSDPSLRKRCRTFHAVEVSPPMLAAMRSRFMGEELSGEVRVEDFDVRAGYPPVRAGTTLSILTLQFTPIEHRLRILRDVYESTVPGGALVLVEKVIGASARIDATMIDAYYAMKRANGYSEEQIERKRLALEGVLVPVTAAWNEDMLRRSGFAEVDCFWRWMNFAGWLAVKR
jgi:tRNA (cmo5U34)-methyltransferase